MRLLLALLLALAVSLGGLGPSGPAAMADASHAEHAAMGMSEADDDGLACDCCQDGQSTMARCAACVCTPVLAVAAPTPVRLVVPIASQGKPVEQALRSRAPEPPRRPPRLVS